MEDDDARPDFTKKKVMKIKAIYQILYYNLYGGKEKTKLHLFIADSVYEKCKSKKVLTSMNRARVSVSYMEAERARNDLVHVTYFPSKNEGVRIPSHLTHIIGVFHDFDHSDRSSWVGKFSNHFTVMTLFQVKPEQQPPAKTGKINIDLNKVTTKGKLPCQEKQQFFCV